MKHHLKFSALLAAALILAAPAYPAVAIAAEATEEAERPSPFKPSATVMEDISEMLAIAKAAGKLGMVVMGANWCHDSQGLC